MIRTLCNDLARTIPSLKRVNRGKMSSHDLGEKAISMGAEKMLIIDRWKGRPGRMRFFEVKDELSQIPPQLYIRGVKFRRDFKVKRSSPQEIFIEYSDENLEIQRLGEAFSRFFEIPNVKANRTDGANEFTIMRVSLDSDSLIQVSFHLMPKNVEVGPRIRISHVVWEI